jgi:hypothetical protein
MEDLTGKEVKGFKFTGSPGYVPRMNIYIDTIGTIKTHNGMTCSVKFDNGDRWAYPYPEILNHLVVEEELTIEQILNNIKKLTSEL